MGKHLNHRYPAMMSTPKPSNGYISLRDNTHTSITYRIINTMGYEVFWRDSTGLIVTEAPNRALNGVPSLTIVVEYQFDISSAFDTRELLKSVGCENRDALHRNFAMQIEEMSKTRSFRGGVNMVTYEVGISEDTLNDCGGLIYLQDLDMVVGYEKRKHEAHHPFSHAGMIERMNSNLAIEEGTQQRIVYVDNSGIQSTRWMNTGQEVLQIKSISDPSLKNGVYVTYTVPDANDVTTHVYTVEEAEKKLGIYISRDEALAFGSPEHRKKEEVKDLEHRVSMEKQEMARLKAISDREKLEAEDQNRRLEQQIKDDERRYAREKDEHEHRYRLLREEMEFNRQRQQHDRDMTKNERKDQSDAWKSVVEVMKAAIAVVSMTLSLFILLQKNAKKDSS